ncbi:MAG: type II CAAX endopeptidase family protein [Gudongella sp.]|nr:type II CAAX endopeptidase family protein [Gudongella sp.]
MKKILYIAIPAIVLMTIVDGLIKPGYISKSLIKIALFLVIPFIIAYLRENKNIFEYLKPKDKKSLFISIALGLGVYVLIIGAYFLISPFIDSTSIKKILSEDLGVNRDNFIFVAIYISFINSLLEEFFFRGFLFLKLLGKTTRKTAYIISAGLFAMYHVAIMGGWFTPYLFILAMIGLFVGGILFNYLNEKNNTILNSWLVHMMANFAINHIGLMMFGIV